jgi:regulator-associated protein of mTOR
VRLWDIRGRSSISRANISGALGGKLSCVAVHERAQVFAA